MASTPAPAPGDDTDWFLKPQETWYGNIQYLTNISILGAVCCVVLFLVVKLRSDHRLPGPASLAAKLVAVWHTTGQQIARLCGANSAQYLSVEGYTFITLAAVSVVALLLILPVNLYGGTVPIDDEFARATVAHVKEGSPLLWAHVVFMLGVTAAVHFCTSSLEKRLQTTRYGDTVDSVAVFTLMVRGVPRVLAMDKRPLEDYFEHRYPGKIYCIVVPYDLDAFYRLKSKLLKTRQELAWAEAQARARQQLLYEEDYFFYDRDSYVDLSSTEISHGSRWPGISCLIGKWSWLKEQGKGIWDCILVCCHLTPRDKLKRLEARRFELESALAAYREGHAQGAGIAFVVFKDVFTASRALQDARTQSKNDRAGFLMVETQLSRGRWKVGRAPPPRDIYWHHLGRSTLERRMRTAVVNLLLLLLLFFCSSPLAAVTAIHNASRFIGPRDTIEQLWLEWARSSNWISTFVLQFLPNVLIFLSMYVVVPAVLAHLSKFESHLTVSGEQQAVLVKTVCFFLVNLILLKALVETTLEAAILHIGQCYTDRAGCKSIKQLMNANFLATSCLSALAFLITSSLLGVSFDLLAPIPWIKRKFLLLRAKNLPGNGSVAIQNGGSTHGESSLHQVLLPDGTHSEDDTVPPDPESANGVELEGQDLAVYPLVKDLRWGIQPFDYAQYYAFNLTIFALVIVYSTFAPVVIPFGALYFGYRYFVDKYNFLFVYRVRGVAAANDGKLMGTVLRVMRLSLCLYLVAMLLFFYVRGDSERLQVLTALALLMVVCAKYGIENLVSPPKDSFDLSVIQGLRTVDEVVDGEEVEYEVLARPNFDWDIGG